MGEEGRVAEASGSGALGLKGWEGAVTATKWGRHAQAPGWASSPGRGFPGGAATSALGPIRHLPPSRLFQVPRKGLEAGFQARPPSPHLDRSPEPLGPNLQLTSSRREANSGVLSWEPEGAVQCVVGAKAAHPSPLAQLEPGPGWLSRGPLSSGQGHGGKAEGVDTPAPGGPSTAPMEACTSVCTHRPSPSTGCRPGPFWPRWQLSTHCTHTCRAPTMCQARGQQP